MAMVAPDFEWSTSASKATAKGDAAMTTPSNEQRTKVSTRAQQMRVEVDTQSGASFLLRMVKIE